MINAMLMTIQIKAEHIFAQLHFYYEILISNLTIELLKYYGNLNVFSLLEPNSTFHIFTLCGVFFF